MALGATMLSYLLRNRSIKRIHSHREFVSVRKTRHTVSAATTIVGSASFFSLSIVCNFDMIASA